MRRIINVKPFIFNGAMVKKTQTSLTEKKIYKKDKINRKIV